MHSVAADRGMLGNVDQTDADRLIPWLFWGFGLALIIPIWMGQHFPTEDGMAHLYWVDVFRQLGHAGNVWEPFYERNVQWNTPNLAYFGAHYALSAIFEAHLALQIFLTLLDSVLGRLDPLPLHQRQRAPGTGSHGFAAADPQFLALRGLLQLSGRHPDAARKFGPPGENIRDPSLTPAHRSFHSARPAGRRQLLLALRVGLPVPRPDLRLRGVLRAS